MDKFSLGFNGVAHTSICVEDNVMITQDEIPAPIIQGILDANRRAEGQINPKAQMRLGARIDLATRNEWEKEWTRKGGKPGTGKTFPEFVIARCNERDFQKFRVNK